MLNGRIDDVLNEMYLSGEVVARFDLKAPWGVNMPAQEGIFHAIEQGDCWVRLSPDGELFQVSPGDLVIFPEGASHEIVNSPSPLAIPLQEALCGMEKDSLVCPVGDLGGSGPLTRFVCGFSTSGIRASTHFAQSCPRFYTYVGIKEKTPNGTRWS